MEVQFQPFQFLFLLPLSIFLFMIFTLLIKSKSKNQTRTHLPPGPRKLPIIGNMHNLITSLPHHRLRDLSLIYGPVMHLQLGEISAVVISSPEAAQQVMKTQDANFASRPSILAAKIVSYDCTSIAFAPYGEYWRQIRKICTQQLLNSKRVDSFKPVREEEISNVNRWIADNDGSRVNLTQKIFASSCSISGRAAFGMKSKEQDVFLSTIGEVVKLAAGFNIDDVFPSVKLLHLLSGMKRRLEKLQKKVDGVLEHIINEHKVRSRGENIDGSVEKQEYLIDVLLKFREDGVEVPLSDDNVKAVLLEMFAGGSDTSATAVDWAMAEMLKNPSVLERAQNEVRRVFNDKNSIDESYFHELKYLRAVVKETLRLHPPSPLLLPRENSQTCFINGYEIPAKTKVIINAWAINRDPKYWEDPECFKPERFLDSLVDYKGNNFEYIPFGAGRRICPGMTFAMANIESQIANYLYYYDWRLPGDVKHEELDMTEMFGMSVRRKQDLYVIPVVKRPLPVE